jgi:hypothetical protein
MISKLSDIAKAEAVMRLVYRAVKHPWNLFEKWERDSCYFPYLIQSPEVLALLEQVAAAVGEEPGEVRSGPQIIFHLPDNEDCKRESFGTHVDSVPPQATEPFYTKIVGVALSDWTERSGTLWIPEWEGRKYLEVPRFHYLVMDGKQPHGLGNNFSSEPRVGIYFRWFK